MRVRGMTRADVPVAADIANAAFSKDELFTWLYPRYEQYPHELRRWWLLRLKQRMVEKGVQTFVAESDEGEVVGFAVWKRLGVEDGEAAKWYKEESFLNLDFERVLLRWEMRYTMFMEQASDKKAIEQMVKATDYTFYSTLKSHWHLATLAVSPRHQRQGIGQKMIAWGLGIAAQEQVPVTLEASMTGRSLYSKLGFKVIECVQVHEELEGVAMLWEGNACAGRWLAAGDEGQAKDDT